MEERHHDFEDPKPPWCLAPIALGVGHGSQRRVLYAPRELLMLHSPVFERMLAEGNGFRESESGAVIELPDDDPQEFDALLRLIFYGISTNFHRVLRLASKYLMEDVIRFFDYCVSAGFNDYESDGLTKISDLSRLIRCIDDASLPQTKALVFREVCTRQRLDELRNDSVWNEISETLQLELTEHYDDDQKKANGREGFCSIDVPEIQWSNMLTFKSPAAEHCGGVSSLCLIVGRGEEKRALYCLRELIFKHFPALREKLHNDSDSLELEDDSADSFVHYMNSELLKSPFEAFSVHQRSAMLCLASKYQTSINFRNIVDSSKEFTLCRKLYLAEQCRFDDLQKKYSDEICESVANFGGTQKSEWWWMLSAELRLPLYDRIFQKIDLSKIRF